MNTSDDFNPLDWVTNSRDNRISSMMGHYKDKGWTVDEFANKVRAFLPHVVTFPHDATESYRPDILAILGSRMTRERWCSDNCQGYWTNSSFVNDSGAGAHIVQWRFQFAEDAVMFKLSCGDV